MRDFWLLSELIRKNYYIKYVSILLNNTPNI